MSGSVETRETRRQCVLDVNRITLAGKREESISVLRRFIGVIGWDRKSAKEQEICSRKLKTEVHYCCCYLFFIVHYPIP